MVEERTKGRISDSGREERKEDTIVEKVEAVGCKTRDVHFLAMFIMTVAGATLRTLGKVFRKKGEKKKRKKKEREKERKRETKKKREKRKRSSCRRPSNLTK